MFNFLTPARKGIRIVAGFALAIGLSACDDLGEIGGGGGPLNEDTVDIALLVPYGSASPGDTGLARSLENAARMAVADLGNNKIKLKVYNTAGQASTAAAVASKAVASGADIIIGPLRSDAANAAAVAVSSKNVNVLAFSNNASIAGGNLFVLGNTFENISNRLIRYAGSQGRNRVVVVRPKTPVGEIAKNAIVEAARNTNAQIVGDGAFEFSQEGITNAAPVIASTVKQTSANAVIITSDSTGALPLLAQSLPAKGVSPSVVKYMGLARWDIPPQTLRLPGLQGGWFTLPDPNLTGQFNARYKKSYGGQPHPLAGLAYDGVAAVGALVAKRRNLSRASLTQSSGFKGVNGAFRLRPDGTTQRALAVAQISGSQAKVIDPAPRSFGFGGF